MFEAELFGIASSEYLRFGQSLLAPLLGFLFLYFLRLPLRKLPIIGGDIDYKPPRWVLPMFSLGTLSAVSVTMTAALTLNNIRISPDKGAAMSMYQRTFRLDPRVGDLNQLQYEIVSYDGLSDFRVFLNGYRLFGTSSHCMMSYQCRTAGDAVAKAAFEKAMPAELLDLSFKHVRSLTTLPIEDDVADYLVQGDNAIDLIAVNTGVGDCNVQANLTFGGPSARKTFSLQFTQQPVRSGVSITDKSSGNDFTFGIDPSEAGDIAPYRTFSENASYRMCERVRILFNVPTTPLPANIWNRRQNERLHLEYCEINPRLPECSRGLQRP